jgi:hypothetical protein
MHEKLRMLCKTVRQAIDNYQVPNGADALYLENEEGNANGSLFGNVSMIDRDRINSIRWMCMSNSHRLMGMIFANALARNFMLEDMPAGKIEAIEVSL